MEDDQNEITLLNDLGEIILKYEDQCYPFKSYVNIQHRLYNIAEGDLANVNSYKNLKITSIKSYGAKIGNNPKNLLNWLNNGNN